MCRVQGRDLREERGEEGRVGELDEEGRKD